jgi:citrate lyase beta subunit
VTAVHDRVRLKLETEPVEDYRIDFEDGYGQRPDAEEDATAVSAAREVAQGLTQKTLPPFIGIRIKPLNEEQRVRALRTLDLFLTTLLDETKRRLPGGFVVTLPKVTIPEQAQALSRVLEVFERRAGLPPQSLRFEIMVETPQSVIGPDGRAALPAIVTAGGGRILGVHFGTYDYTAGCGITAAHQSVTHPSCDFAKHIMQVSLAGTGILLSDGATNVLPVPVHRPKDGGTLSPSEIEENRASVHRAWRLHYEHIRHSLRSGFYQGWDLHPAQLPTRFAAVTAFFLESLPAATERLKSFVEKAAQATLVAEVFDDAATGQALLNFFLRGLGAGALTEAEVLATGLTLSELRSRSFPKILAGRQGR